MFIVKKNYVRYLWKGGELIISYIYFLVRHCLLLFFSLVFSVVIKSIVKRDRIKINHYRNVLISPSLNHNILYQLMQPLCTILSKMCILHNVIRNIYHRWLGVLVFWDSYRYRLIFTPPAAHKSRSVWIFTCIVSRSPRTEHYFN